MSVPISAASAQLQQTAAAMMASQFGQGQSPTHSFTPHPVSAHMASSMSAFPASMFPPAQATSPESHLTSQAMPRSTSLPQAGPGQPLVANTAPGAGLLTNGMPTPAPGDSLAETAKQSRALLHSYIYDYLYRSGFADAARGLLQNAPDTDVVRASDAGKGPGSSPAKEGDHPEASTSGDGATEQAARSDHLLGGSDGDSTNSSTSHFGFPSVRETQQNGGGSDSSPSASAGSPRLKSRDGPDLAEDPARPKDLPLPHVEHKHPQGFLYTWWNVHWDIYNATRNKGGSQAAKLYAEARQSAEGVQMMPKPFNPARSTAQPSTAAISAPQTTLPYPFNQQQQQPPANGGPAIMSAQQAQAFARALTRPPSANSIAAPQAVNGPPNPAVQPSAPIQAPSPAQQNHMSQIQQQQQHMQNQQQQQAEAAARAAVVAQQRNQQLMEQHMALQRRQGMAGPIPQGMPNGSMPNGPMIQQRVPIAPPGMQQQQQHPQYYHMMAAQQQQSQAQMIQAQQQQQQQQQRDSMVGRGPPPGFQNTISRPASATAMHASPNGMLHQRQVTRIMSGPDGGQPMEQMDASSPLNMPPSPSKRNRALGQDANLMPYNAQSPSQAQYEALAAAQMQQHQNQQRQAHAQQQAQAQAAAQMHAQQQYAMSAANQAQQMDAYRKGLANNQQQQQQLLQKGRSPSMPPTTLPPGSMGPQDAAAAAHFAQQYGNPQYAMEMQRQLQQSPSLRPAPGFPGSPSPSMAMPSNQQQMYAHMAHLQQQQQQQGRPPHMQGPQMAGKQPGQQNMQQQGPMRANSMPFEHQMGPPDMPGGGHQQVRPPSAMMQHPAPSGSTPQQQPGTPANIPMNSPSVGGPATPHTPQLAGKEKAQPTSKKRSADNSAVKEPPKKARKASIRDDSSEIIPVRPDATPDLAEVLSHNKDLRLTGLGGNIAGNLDAMAMMQEIGGVTANGDLTSIGLDALSTSPELDRNLWDMFVNDGMSASGSWDPSQGS